MEKLEKFFVILGVVLVAYAVFSRFYGQPSVALTQFRSLSFLILANIAFTIALVTKKK